MPDFVHLNVHSNFSMLEGANTVEEIVEAAARMGMDALALTDTNGLYAAVPFTRACRARGIRPIYGVELACAPRRAVLLARDMPGYQAICRIITDRHLDASFDWETRIAELPLSVIVLSDDLPLLARCARNPERRRATLAEVHAWEGPDARTHRARTLDAAARLKLAPVATNAVRLVVPGDHEIHRILSALRCNTTIGNLPPGTLSPPCADLKSPSDMSRRLKGLEGALRMSVRVAEACRVDLDLDQRHLPKFPVPGGGDAYLHLRGLALRGLSERYAESGQSAARKVLERELAVIDKMHLADYFLICWDIVRFARSHRIPCLGRGSAANSIVSFCLHITHVDPIVHNLFFERFLNEQRASLPDFDLDFGTADRERVLDYIVEFYGERHVAMIGTHVTFQIRGAFREVAVALGLPKSEVDGFIKRLPHYSGTGAVAEKLAGSPETRGLPLEREPFRTLGRFVERIGGFPRNMATHPCGLVITPDPIVAHMPLQRGDKGLTITQWSMGPVEDAGLLKIDILGQKGLEVISHTSEAVRRQGKSVPEDPRVFLADAVTREWLREGRSIGCFYIESPAMIGLIRQARCDDFECLTALSSIIRPGVSNYGGKHSYLRRHLKLEPETLAHPLLRPILRDTRGCLIYQEQVIRIASELAGLTLAEADDLRRQMSYKKNHKKLVDYRDRFYEGCRSKGMPEVSIDEVYRQVESFSGYAFCKAHSASFALESFESMYFKSHHPAEFMAAVLSGGGGYYGALEYMEEARRLGLTIHSPCVNGSEIRFTGAGEHLRVGLMQVKSLSEETAGRIVGDRERSGPFRDLIDFLERVRPDVSEARSLARCGALRSLGRTIPESLWGIEIYYHDLPETPPADRNAGVRRLLNLVPPLADPMPSDMLRSELELLGLTISAHPFRIFSDEVARVRRLRPVVRSVDLSARAGRDTYALGWRVIGKKTRTKKTGELMVFITFSDEWGRFEATFFPVAFEQNAQELLKGHGPFLLRGRVDVEFGVPMLITERAQLIASGQPEIRNTCGPLRRPVPARVRK